MGPSGAGKTTLMRFLSMRLEGLSSQGRVLVGGIPITGKVTELYLQSLGYVQQFGLPTSEDVTVLEAMYLGALLRCAGKTQRQCRDLIVDLLCALTLSEQAELEIH